MGSQEQDQTKRMVTSIPSSSLDEPSGRTRLGLTPKVAPRFSVSVSAPEKAVRGTAPLNVVVTLSNLTDGELPWAPGYQDLRLTIRRGATENERTAFHRFLRGEPAAEDKPMLTSGSHVTLMIPPHKSASQTLDLRKLYEFNSDGDYSIVVQRYDEVSDVFVRSNTVTIRYSK